MSTQLSNTEILSQYDLNWTVKKSRLHFEDENGVFIPTKDFGLVRSDNNVCLGVAKEGYHPFQNESILNTLREFGNKYDLPIQKGGTFGGGKKIYFLLNVGGGNIGGEKTREFIFAANSFDKTCQLSFGYTNTVISCQNTFNRVMKYDVEYRFRHTANGEEKILELPGLFERYLGFKQETNATLEKLSGVYVTAEVMESLVAHLTDTDILAVNGLTEGFKELSTKKKNIITQLHRDIRSELNAKGETLWGLFNGVTWYANHSHTVKKTNTKDESILAGTGHNMMNKAYDFLAELV